MRVLYQVSTSSDFGSSETKTLTDANTISQASFVLVLYKEDVSSTLHSPPDCSRLPVPDLNSSPQTRSAGIANTHGECEVSKSYVNGRWHL